MYAKTLLLLAATASAGIINVRIPLGMMDTRSIAQGWSLQAQTCPANSNTCGSGACCPNGLTCNTAANDEVAACCTSGDCRGEVEGAPTCADSSWSLYKGLNGNGFCCQVGMIGVMDYSQKVAGSCVAATTAGQSTAQIVSTGSGSAAAVTSAAPVVATTTAVAPVVTSTAVVPAAVATTAAPVAASSTAAAAPVAASSTAAAAVSSVAPASSAAVATSSAAQQVVTATSTNAVVPVASSVASNVASAASSGTSSAAAAVKTGGAAKVGGASLALLGVAAVAVMAL